MYPVLEALSLVHPQAQLALHDDSGAGVNGAPYAVAKVCEGILRPVMSYLSCCGATALRVCLCQAVDGGPAG